MIFTSSVREKRRNSFQAGFSKEDFYSATGSIKTQPKKLLVTSVLLRSLLYNTRLPIQPSRMVWLNIAAYTLA